MNPYQAARQIQYLLLKETWADSPSQHVFGQGADGVDGAVRVSDGPLPEAVAELRFPFAFISIDSREADPEEPDLYQQDFNVVVVQAVEGDPFAERVLVGSNRGSTSGAGGSDGRGILEIEERVLHAVGRLTGANGARAVIVGTKAPPAAKVEGASLLVASRSYTVRAWCTRAEHFEPPLYLASGGGNLTWTLPPDRWDLHNIILRYNTGSTPPTSATTGTGVTLSSDLATSVASVGGRAYAVFAGYDETGSGTAERYSDPSFTTTVAT